MHVLILSTERVINVYCLRIVLQSQLRIITDLWIFHISDAGNWYVDLKNGSGAIGTGEPASPADVTFTLNDQVFQDIFQGKVGYISIL